MRDLFLRFTDANEMRTQLSAAGVMDDEGQCGLHHPNISLDVVGVITVPGEILNPGQENEVIKYVSLPGFHANLRVTDDSLELASLDAFGVFPDSPYRVWA
ncbi:MULTISPECIES: hypothetical protein [unclassified Leclercia]|uniref:hypothetical protein n=1 Tax=unclassified Leclercia TaxID=2627398 RepID=UPI0025BD5385|nr:MULTISPECIES: hypothetical protein [unclassified Leclercia]